MVEAIRYLDVRPSGRPLALRIMIETGTFPIKSWVRVRDWEAASGEAQSRHIKRIGIIGVTNALSCKKSPQLFRSPSDLLALAQIGVFHADRTDKIDSSKRWLGGAPARPYAGGAGGGVPHRKRR